MHTGHHNGDAIALEDSTVCIIPFGQLEQMCREVRPMQHHVYQMMSGEIVRESALMLLLGTMTAEQRVAAFLLNLSTRFKARGYSAAEFVLRMTRDEIGEYLGMKLETVSRMMSKFQHKSRRRTRQADPHRRSGRPRANLTSRRAAAHQPRMASTAAPDKRPVRRSSSARFASVSA